MSSYKDHKAGEGEPAHSWVGFTYNRLCEVYGAKRADAIFAGRDAKTNADLAAWYGLGEGRRAA